MPLDRLRPTALAGITACSVALGAACGGGDGSERSASRFCAELATNKDALIAVPASSGEIDALLELVRRIEKVAPLAIEQEWDQVVLNLETASTVDPSDPASVQLVADTAYVTERSATAVAAWARGTCGIEVGPVGTVAPPPAPTTAISDDG